MTQPTFERCASATLNRVASVFCERGTEYGDSWKDAQWLTMKAIAKQFNVQIPPQYLGALALAALCDVKYNRLTGGYKDDTLVDGIAYSAALAQVVLEIQDNEEGVRPAEV